MRFFKIINGISENQNSFWFLLILFTISKLTHLNISFFWDESWVYAPALKTMLLNGPSLLPGSIPLEYSRGHPLLFHFLGSLWMKIMGDSNMSMHGFALSVSLLFLVCIYSLLREIFNAKTAFWTVLFIVLSPLFYAQSSMILPEIMLATFSFVTLYFYLKSKYILYFIFGIAAIFTKETGIIVVFSVALYEFIKQIIAHKNAFKAFYRGLLFSIPALGLLLHMFMLKQTFGWYLYPEHTGLMKTDFENILRTFKHIILDQIWIQKRYIILILAMGLILVQLFAKGINKVKFSWSPFVLICLFILFYDLFASANFYTVRYLLSSFPLILAIPVFYALEKNIWKKYVPLVFLLLVPLYIVQLLNPKKINDVNLTYLNYCSTMSEAVSYFEENELYHEQINTLFLSSVALNDDRAGYRITDQKFQFVNQENNGSIDYYIFDNIEPNGQYEQISQSQNAELIQRIEKGNIWMEIWSLKH